VAETVIIDLNLITEGQDAWFVPYRKALPPVTSACFPFKASFMGQRLSAAATLS